MSLPRSLKCPFLANEFSLHSKRFQRAKSYFQPYFSRGQNPENSFSLRGLQIVFTQVIKILATVATPPYWWTKNVNKPSCMFTVKMVFCMVVGCGSKSSRDKGLNFSRVPSVVTNQGEEAENYQEKDDHVGFLR